MSRDVVSELQLAGIDESQYMGGLAGMSEVEVQVLVKGCILSALSGPFGCECSRKRPHKKKGFNPYSTRSNRLQIDNSGLNFLASY